MWSGCTCCFCRGNSAFFAVNYPASSVDFVAVSAGWSFSCGIRSPPDLRILCCTNFFRVWWFGALTVLGHAGGAEAAALGIDFGAVQQFEYLSAGHYGACGACVRTLLLLFLVADHNCWRWLAAHSPHIFYEADHVCRCARGRHSHVSSALLLFGRLFVCLLTTG